MKYFAISCISVIALMSVCTCYISTKAVVWKSRRLQVSYKASILNVYELLANSCLPKNETCQLLQFIAEKELALKDKEQEKQLALNDREQEKLLALKEKEIVNLHELNNRDMMLVFITSNKDSEIILLREKLNNLQKDYLMSGGACTARGILEFYLKGVGKELGMKGNFNARSVCTEIGKIIFIIYQMDAIMNIIIIIIMLNFNVENLNPIIDGEKTSQLTVILGALKNCGMNRSSLYNFYGKMSNSIHGQPWNGPSLKVSKDLSTDELCFITALAEAKNIEVEPIS
jgi:hypothetical protein